MLLSPLLANACYIHILKRKRERERKGEKETVKCQTPFIQIFKCIAMDLNPQLKLCTLMYPKILCWHLGEQCVFKQGQYTLFLPY